MKKTMQTLMTAAAFAVASGAVAGSIPDQNQVAAMENQILEANGTYTQTVYGPPPSYDDTTTDPTHEETTFTTTVTDEPFDPSTNYATPLYGPPPSVLINGDINFDDKLDARDLSLMKKKLMDGSYVDDWRWSWDPPVYDINEDGEFNKEDVKTLRRLLTGKSLEEEQAEEAAQQTEPILTTTASTVLTTSTSIGTTFTQTLPTTPVSTTIQTVYGPPPVGD
ncbi:MAG TPA: hypothetical protein DCG49_05370 [Ruminococcus sp.]|nr:hypothetical protein [Ruminococcus sp.]